jgi:hypothetical protein
MSNRATAAGQQRQNPCLPDETPGYTSADPKADWARFQDAMKTIVSVPKENVENEIDEGKKNGGKGKAK